jgi:16S rRNA processing protein RimM
MVSVGRVTRPQGNRGEVMVVPDTDFGDERFRPGATIFVNRDGDVAAVTVAESREHRGNWVLRFDGVDSIDGAERYRGAELKVPAEALKALEAGAFYVHDLLGCDVRTLAGTSIGHVERVDLATGVPMLAVGLDREEVLVPLVDAICKRIDVDEKVIEIDPPAGLIDLNRKS